MDSEVVSSKMLIICLSISVGFLLIKGIFSNNTRTQVLLCNSKKGIEIYVRDKRNDLIVEPLNIKNLLGCMGRGMPYYDRTVEIVLGNLRPVDQRILNLRYSQISSSVQKDKKHILNGSALYIGGKYRTLIFRKEVDIKVLKSMLKEYQINQIILSETQEGVLYIKALERTNLDIKYVRIGENIKV